MNKIRACKVEKTIIKCQRMRNLRSYIIIEYQPKLLNLVIEAHMVESALSCYTSNVVKDYKAKEEQNQL